MSIVQGGQSSIIKRNQYLIIVRGQPKWGYLHVLGTTHLVATLLHAHPPLQIELGFLGGLTTDLGCAFRFFDD